MFQADGRVEGGEDRISNLAGYDRWDPSTEGYPTREKPNIEKPRYQSGPHTIVHSLGGPTMGSTVSETVVRFVPCVSPYAIGSAFPVIWMEYFPVAIPAAGPPGQATIKISGVGISQPSSQICTTFGMTLQLISGELGWQPNETSPESHRDS